MPEAKILCSRQYIKKDVIIDVFEKVIMQFLKMYNFPILFTFILV